jgi:hypothetical protein
VEAHWPAGTPLRVRQDHLCEALSAAFQASLTSEEGRPTRFRLLLMPMADLPEDGRPNDGALRLRFDPSRALLADELRRLSPSVPFETSLIGAHVEDGRLRIWGIAHSGPAWLAPSWGGRGVVPNWTTDPIIHATGPGRLAVRCAGNLVGGLERGVLIDTLIDVFESEWLPALFDRERTVVQETHAASQARALSPTAVEPSLVKRLGQHMVRRAIQLIRGGRHGGMILVTEPGDPHGMGGLRLKYRFGQDEPSHRYRTVLFRILEVVSASVSKASVGWSDFVGDGSAELERLEQAVFELSRLVANLSAVDGAVVLDKRLGLLGFGAEVSAELPTPPQVWRSLDTEGSRLEPYDTESVGTRHRAAFRFIHDHPQGLAIVVSHDGGVSFVAKREDRVLVWDQSVSP